MYGTSGGSLSGDPRLPSTGNPRHSISTSLTVSEHSPVDAGEARHDHSFARLFQFFKAVAFSFYAGLAVKVLLADAARKLVQNNQHILVLLWQIQRGAGCDDQQL